MAMPVAPLTGSVDRNRPSPHIWLTSRVAPLTGSVDRNSINDVLAAAGRASLPSRGAWIEIRHSGEFDLQIAQSLPSRGAWIEITT